MRFFQLIKRTFIGFLLLKVFRATFSKLILLRKVFLIFSQNLAIQIFIILGLNDLFIAQHLSDVLFKINIHVIMIH